MGIFEDSSVIRPSIVNNEIHPSLLLAPGASVQPKAQRPHPTSRSASQFIIDKLTNNKRKGGGGMGCGVFYGVDKGADDLAPETQAPAGTLDALLNDKEEDQEQEHQQRLEAGARDPRSPSPVGLAHINDDCRRRTKSPRLEYDSNSTTRQTRSKTRSFVAALASGMRSCIADVEAQPSTKQNRRKRAPREDTRHSPRPSKRSSPDYGLARSLARSPRAPVILAPPHHSLPPISAESVARNLASEREKDNFFSFASLGVGAYDMALSFDMFAPSTGTTGPFAPATQTTSTATAPAAAAGPVPIVLDVPTIPVPVLTDAERDALFQQVFGEDLAAAGMSPTPGLQHSGLPIVGHHHPTPASEDGELESPPVDAHPPLMVDSVIAPNADAGPSSEQATAEPTSTSSPVPKPDGSHLQVSIDEATEARRRLSEHGFHTPIERAAVRERTISGLIRRYSLLEVQLSNELDADLPPAPHHSATEIRHTFQVVDPRRAAVGRQPSFRPQFVFPERPPTLQAASPASTSLENALQLTINGRAPPRPAVATIALPTDQEFRTMFDMDSESTQWSPNSTSPDASSTLVEEPVRRRATESPVQDEATRAIIARSHAAADAMQAVRHAADPGRDTFRMITNGRSDAPPDTPQRRYTPNTPDQPRAARATPRSVTEPALRHAAFGSLPSYRSLHHEREDSLAPKDLTVGTEAIRYLATADLHPEFNNMYRITEMLGAGGFGFVCIAETTGYGNVKPGIEVAVKFLFKRRPGSYRPSPIPMVDDEPLEAYLLRNCDHTGIIDCFDLFEDDMMYYMVLELHGHAWEKEGNQNRLSPSSALVDANGQAINPFTRPDMPRRASHDLFEAVEHNSFTLLQSKNIFLQIVDAVDYLHQRGIYHRDLKDENVVIDKHLQVKLIDFGSAVMENPHQPRVIYADEFKGTEAYAPPEVFTYGYYEAADTDIWALGILLSVLTSGDPPMRELDGHIRPDRPRLHRHVDPDAYDLICKCMRSDPRKRIDIDGIISHKWLNSLDCGVPTSQWTNGSRYRVNTAGEFLEEDEFFEDPEALVEEPPEGGDEELLREVDMMHEEGWSN